MSLLKENRYSIDLIRWLTRSNLFITTGRVNPIFVSALFIAFLFMTLFCVTACGKVEKSSITHPEQIAYEVVDDQGNAIKMLGKPQKIMTTHFYLDAMVLGIVPPERMVSISKTASDPAVSYMVKQAEKVQNHTSEISLETVVALSPDLIITREGTGEEMVQSYRDLGIPVFVIKMPLTVEGIKQQIHLIAKIVGEPDRGNLLVDKMERQLETIENKLQSLSLQKKSCVLVSKMNHSYGGKGCMFDDICKYAGVQNAVAEIGIENGQIISKEILVQADPDFFLLSQSWEIKHGNEEAYQDEFFIDPALNHLKAVKNNQVIYLPDKYIYASHQNCIWSIKRIANAAYGDIFDLKDECFIKAYE